MSVAHASHVEAPVAGGRAFLSPTARSTRCRELAEEGFLVARVVPVADETEDEEPSSRPSWHGGPLRRGGLREALEGAVEISLALRGALPPSVEVDGPELAMANDQLFRVRTLRANGLCIVLPSLQRLAENGLLDDADSATLRTWRALSESQPVWILFDDADRGLQMLAPTKLASAFGLREAPVRWADDARDGLEALDAIEERFSEDEDEDERISGDQLRDVAERHALLEALAADDDAEEIDGLDATDGPGDVCQAWHRDRLDEEELHQDEDEDELDEDDEDDVEHEAQTRPMNRVMAADPLAGIDDLEDEPRQGSLFDAARPSSPDVERFATAPPPPRPPADDPEPEPPQALVPEPPPMDLDEVEQHCEALEEARGPKPVKAIEQLFRTRYAPLAEGLCRGLRDPRAEDVVDEWRESFEHSYHEGFNTMRVTGRRPTMVLDVPEVAIRIGKLNGARAVQLLLVDGMRYDLGRMVQAELKQRLASHAACVEETLLWSALPTVTPVQMRLLARGAAGLREPEPASERDPVIHRDGSLTTLRRVRIGPRDLLKLDLVEGRLREAGPGYHERLSAIAVEVSEVIARFAESLPPRTLLYLFGDHGFHLPIEGPDATGPAEQGGATPEEALVGGWAWLVEDTH